MGFPRARSTALQLATVAIVGLAAYSNTFSAPFVFDDIEQIARSPFLKEFRHTLSPGSLPGHAERARRPGFTSPTPARRVGYLSLALNYRLHGLDVVGYHVFNTCLHVANALLVYLLVRLLLVAAARRGWAGAAGSGEPDLALLPFVVALLFIAHPLQTQAVTYVIQRLASLATFFYLASVCSFLAGRLAGSSRRGWALIATSVASALLAMHTKEIAVTLPAIVVIADLVFFAGGWRARLPFLLPVLATQPIVPLLHGALVAPGSGQATAGGLAALRETEDISRSDYLRTQFVVVSTYVRLLLVPVAQNVDHDVPVFRSLGEPRVFAGLAFLSSIAAAGLVAIGRGIRRASATSVLAGFGVVWFFVALSVESSFVPIRDVIFEHRVYLASVGALLALAAIGFRVAHAVALRWPALGRSGPEAIALVVLLLAGATFARNDVWADPERLWKDAIQKSPAKARPRNMLGMVYMDQRRFPEAIEQFEAAVRLKPDDADAHNNLGLAYIAVGRMDQGRREMAAAYAKGHYLAGADLLNAGRVVEAVRELESAVASLPTFTDARIRLAEAYGATGRFEEARQQSLAVIDARPQDAEAHRLLGMASAEVGRNDEALVALRRSVELRPRDPDSRFALGVVLRRMGRTDEAAREFRVVLELSPGHGPATAELARLERSSTP